MTLVPNFVFKLSAWPLSAAFVLGGTQSVTAQSGAEALPLGDGLTGVYYYNEFDQVAARRVDRAIDFDWSFRAPQAGCPASHFSVRWTGYLYAPLTGTYTFRVITDDGMRVWVGGQLLIDEWRPQPPLVASGQAVLRSGQYYPVRVEYFQEERVGRAFLGWDLPGDPPAFSADDITTEGPSIRPVLPRPISQAYLFTRLPAQHQAWTAPKRAAPTNTASTKVGAAPRMRLHLAPVRVSGQERAMAAARPAPHRVILPSLPALTDLNTAATGTALALPQLYFVQSTATLHVNSRPELERLVARLQAAPAVRLEIAGHTDNVGDSVKNVLLSYQRAAVVRAYLIGHGIDSARVRARGYGGTRPIADNADPAQRPRNRRVEIIIR